MIMIFSKKQSLIFQLGSVSLYILARLCSCEFELLTLWPPFNQSQFLIRDVQIKIYYYILTSNIMQTLAVKVENISFMHIKGTSATEEAIKFACSNDYPCEGLYLEDILLVSCSGGTTKSFCWKAYGSSLGLVYPPACFSCSESFIKQKVLLDSAIDSS